MIREIIALYPTEVHNSFDALSRKLFIKNVNDRHEIKNLVADNFKSYMSKARDVCASKSKNIVIFNATQFFAKKSRDMDPSTALVQGSYNHSINIEQRLSFLKVIHKKNTSVGFMSLLTEHLSGREPLFFR